MLRRSSVRSNVCIMTHECICSINTSLTTTSSVFCGTGVLSVCMQHTQHAHASWDICLVCIHVVVNTHNQSTFCVSALRHSRGQCFLLLTHQCDVATAKGSSLPMRTAALAPHRHPVNKLWLKSSAKSQRSPFPRVKENCRLCSSHSLASARLTVTSCISPSPSSSGDFYLAALASCFR